MKPIYKLIIVCVCISSVFSCNQKTTKSISSNKQKSVVRSPFKNVNLPIETFVVNPGQDQILTTANGSKIIINKESLVNENGELIKEPVTISLESFMDPAEIMTAGIPMKYSDESTKSSPFQSAGMFDIQATTNSGTKVMINQAHPVSMELATYRTEKGFDNYYLDTMTGKWTKTEADNLHLNLDKEDVKKQLAKLKSKTAFNGNLFVFNFNLLLDEFLNDNYESIYPYIVNKKKKLPSKLLKYGVEAEDIWDYQLVMLNNNEVPAALIVWEKVSKEKFPIWTKNQNAKHQKLDGNLYELSIENPNNKGEIFKTKIRPKMTIKSLFKVDPEKWSSDFAQTLKEIEEQEVTLSKMNDLSRTLQINQFGIYNCDRLYKEPNSYLSNVEFTFPKGKHGFTPDRIFYVSTRDKICIDYEIRKENTLTLCSDPTASLFTVLEGDVLAQVPSEELMKCSNEKLGKQTLTFKSKAKIHSVKDLKKLMGI